MIVYAAVITSSIACTKNFDSSSSIQKQEEVRPRDHHIYPWWVLEYYESHGIDTSG